MVVTLIMAVISVFLFSKSAKGRLRSLALAVLLSPLFWLFIDFYHINYNALKPVLKQFMQTI
jgi:hypothetical protein